jgi:hypothetical protein
MIALALCVFAAAGQLPDRGCTPGAVLRQVTPANAQRTICRPGWATTHRHVTPATKARVRASYGVAATPFPAWEIDHLVPLELGGSNATANLWPEHHPAAKDVLEGRLHRAVCAGRLSLRAAQHRFATDWRRA